MENSIGQVVKAEIKKNGRTCKWVAEKLGISESYMSQKLSGVYPFTYPEIREIRKLLGLPNDWTGTTEEQEFAILELWYNGMEEIDVIAEQTNSTFEQVSSVIINELNEKSRN